jgi:hypothetical protein
MKRRLKWAAWEQERRGSPDGEAAEGRRAGAVQAARTPKQSFLSPALELFIRSRETSTTVQASYQVVLDNSTGQILLELSSRNYDCKQNCQ